MGSAGLRKWTQRFTIASAGSFVLFLLATRSGVGRPIPLLIAVFGFICPMIFGMAYLLLPPYVGTTLVDQRLAGVHFVATYLGAGSLVGDRLVGDVGLFRLVGDTDVLVYVGTASWTLGVVVFVGSLLASVAPVLVRSPTEVFRGGDTPQRSTRLATATMPAAIGYLVVGTAVLVVAVLPTSIGSATLSQVTHYYLIGFGTLLIYSLGARLLLGFFHVSPPRAIVRAVLVTGLIAPIPLGTYLWIGPWFRIGAVAAAASMTGYVGLVLFVARETSRVRVGLSGIVLGAVAGGIAVGSSLPVAFGLGEMGLIAAHRTLVLVGFFPLTIVGYAYLFFPVSEGQFTGAHPRSARATIGLLGVGVTLQVAGILTPYELLASTGTAASVLGAIGYSYLLGRRFAST
jgi:hypothetical protein